MYRYLDAFLLVASTGSLSKAAEKLYLSTAAVSKQISSLEGEVQVQLFDRTNRGMVLTEAGIAFYKSSLIVKQDIQAAVMNARKAAGLKENKLTMGITGLECIRMLPAILNRFRKRFPEVQIEFKTTTHIEKEEQIANHTIDLAFSYGRTQPLNRTLENHLLTDDPVVCLIPLAHPLCDRDCLSIEDLRGETVMTYMVGASDYYDELTRYIQQMEPAIRLLYSSTSLAELNASLLSHPCPSFCTRLCATTEINGIPLFRIIPFVSPLEEKKVSIGLLHRKGQNIPADHFIHVAAEAIGELQKSPEGKTPVQQRADETSLP